MKQQGKAYSEQQKVEIIEKIADRMMDGMSLRKICSEKDIPPKTTVLRWLNEDESHQLVTTIARARGLQADAKFDQVDEILVDVRSGELDPHAANVMIRAIQWQTSKLNPKRYGDKVLKELSGPGQKPIEIISADVGAEEAARLYRELME